MSSSRVSLSDLPDEVLLDILNFFVEMERRLYWHRCSQTIYNLSLTNHRLRHLVTPLLYERFAFHLTTPGQFQQSFVRDPGLGRLVEYVRWKYQGAHDGTGCDGFVGNRSGLLDRPRIAQAVTTKGTPFALELSASLDRINERDERSLAAFLMFTPYIKILDIVDRFEFDSHRFWVDTIGLEIQETFQMLKVVRIRTGEMRLKNVLPLVLLPSMRELELSELMELDPSNDPHGVADLGCLFDIPPKSSNITHFHLRYCVIDSLVTKALLHLFHNLHSFEHALASAKRAMYFLQLGLPSRKMTNLMRFFTMPFFITLLSTASSLCYWPNGAVYYSPDHTACPNTPACCAYYTGSNPNRSGAALYHPDSMQHIFVSSNLSTTFDMLAQSMTNNFRMNDETGTLVYGTNSVTVYKVRWPWVILPAIELVGGMLFLGILILYTRKSGAPLWKSSALPVLKCGTEIGEVLRESQRLSEMRKVAKEANMDLLDMRIVRLASPNKLYEKAKS